jgi:protein arginine kinase activator
MYSKKKCMKCGNQAEYKFTRIEAGKVYDLFLCGDHAQEMSPYQKPKIPLSDILEGLLKHELTLKASGSQPPEGLSCSSCGIAFEVYKKNLILGCGVCYESFREYLIPDLLKLHGDTRHCGRQPGGEMARPPRREAPPKKIVTEVAEADPTKDVIPEIMEKHVTPPDPQKDMGVLAQKLKKAIHEEDFLSAARYRDRLRQIKERLTSTTSQDSAHPSS